jgi:hypothetical protein
VYVLLRAIFSSCYKICVCKGVWTSAANNRNVFVLQVRDRPFNLQRGYGVFFVQNVFFGQHKSSNIFFCRAEREFFFQNSTCAFEFKIVMKLLSTRAWQHTLQYFVSLIFNNSQYLFVFHYLGLFKFWEFVNYWFIYRIFGCDRKKIRTYCDTTVTLTDRYPFFTSLYKS